MSNLQEKQLINDVDRIWDGWLSSVKDVQKCQEDVQQKALQAFSYQKELLDFSVKTLNTIEKETEKVSKDWNDNLRNGVKQSNLDQDSKWLNTIQHITESVHLLSWKPSYTMLDVLIKSQEQVEVAMKKAFASQQQVRAENDKKIEELCEQMKAAHKGILKPIQA